jgi:YfiH family protein
MFCFQDSRGSVEVAFTDRSRGVGGGGPDVDGLDLAEPAPDAADLGSALDTLEENLDIVGHALARGGPPTGESPFDLPDDAALPTLVRMRQVHGADVQTVDEAWSSRRHRGSDLPVADALVTAVPGVALVVRVADCVPVLLADPRRGVLGAAHAGRPGLVAGIVPAAVARMRELGADEILAWVGPHVCGRCYEVPAQMREEVAATVPESFGETSWGTPSVDVGAGVRAQLAHHGVDVVDASRCTLEHDDLYSYRRDGAAAGRLAGLVWMRP